MERTDKIISQVRTEERKVLLEPEAKAVCVAYGIPVTKFNVAKNEQQAVKFAEEMGRPG